MHYFQGSREHRPPLVGGGLSDNIADPSFHPIIEEGRLGPALTVHAGCPLRTQTVLRPWLGPS